MKYSLNMNTANNIIYKIKKKEIPKFLVLLSLLVFSSNAYCQSNNQNLAKNNIYEPFYFNISDLKILATNTKYKNLIIYTFSNSCSPCIYHLQNAIDFSTANNLDLYILLVEDKIDRIQNSIAYLRKKKRDVKILLIKTDNKNSLNHNYKKILKELTPTQFENLNDLSKYIVFNKLGEVIMVTNWKDNKKNDWRSDSTITKEKILPILNK